MTRYESSGTAGLPTAERSPAPPPTPAEPPVDILDRLLWRDARQMLDRHAAPGPDGTCGWCGWQWPCPPRRLAERAEAAARRPWREAWTARHDLNGLRALPSWRSGRPAGPAGPPAPAARGVPGGSPEGPGQLRRNAGLFD